MFFVNTGIEKIKVTNEIYQAGGAGLTSHEEAAIYLNNFGGSGAVH
jgi:hypothetical protein